MPPGVSVIGNYKPFENSPFPVFMSGHVHLDVCCIDQCTSLPNGLCCLSIHHISNDVMSLKHRKRQISKWLVMANHTHTPWHNITPLSVDWDSLNRPNNRRQIVSCAQCDSETKDIGLKALQNRPL